MAKRQRSVQTRLQDKMLRGAVEGAQEELYFDHLEKLINRHPARKKNLRINFSVSRGGSPLKVARKAVEIKTTGSIDRAEAIVRQHEMAGIQRHTPKSVRYYDNPDLSIHRLVQQILKHAGL